MPLQTGPVGTALFQASLSGSVLIPVGIAVLLTGLAWEVRIGLADGERERELSIGTTVLLLIGTWLTGVGFVIGG